MTKFFVILALCLAGCVSPVKNPKLISKEAKLAQDLIGQTTGGREKSWLFRPGQITGIEITSDKGDVVVAVVTVHAAETNEDFLMVLEVHYEFCLTHCHNKIESVGQRYIRKLN